MPRKSGNRTPVSVEVAVYEGANLFTLRYAFLSGLKASLLNDFAQVPIDNSTSVSKLVFKANNIKPPKAQIFQGPTLGYEGSFCSSVAALTLRETKGAVITKLKYKPLALSGRAGSQLYYATVNGLKIGYRVNDNSLPTDFATATGLTLATADDFVIWGAAFPTLGFVKYQDPTTGKVKRYACDPTRYDNLTGNWSKDTAPLTNLQSFLAMVGV